MKLMNTATMTVLTILCLGSPTIAAVAAQAAAVTSTDVQRLQDSIDSASRDIDRLQSRDDALASQLRRELDDARDEVTYLRVKLRRNETVAREDYWNLRDRIENIQSRASGTSPAGPPTPGPRESVPQSPRDTTTSSGRLSEIPVGTEFDVRLQNSLSSGSAHVEDRFEATTVVDLKDGDRVLVPAGAVMRGVVSAVTKAGRIERKGALTVTFDRITVGERSYPIKATVEQALESEGIRGELGKIGAGAGVGAVLGAVLGGTKGALAGIVIGGGGVTAATDGKDVELPAGTALRVRLDTALVVD